MTNAVRQLLKRQDDLKTELTELKTQMSQQGEQVKQLASSAAKGAHSFLFSAGVVGSLAVFCAPIGLFLVWKHPTWEKARKLQWTAVSIACLVIFGIVNQMQKSAALKTLAEANQLWESGSKEDAIDQYRSLVSDLSYLDKQDSARVLRRVIEFDCENDNLEEARELVEKADRLGIKLSLTNPKAKALVAQVEAERKEAEREKEAKRQQAEREKKSQSGTPSEQLEAAEWGNLVSAASLYSKFNGNEVAAEAEFKGKTISIDGEVVNVAKTAFSGITINLKHQGGFGSVGVRCVLSSSGARTDDLSKVGPGSWIKVRGKCEGKLPSGAVRMSGCNFILVNR
ncbi:MAG: hypothetical protein IH899_13570 [Planctomycetes bacterium]|nr:hypothetical protein [Planctomycetota bacterium]